jgi:uncharacterized protein YgiM (DUF1202 family)
MLDVFVIAFIHCAGQECAISYPRPDLAYRSYSECKDQLPVAPAGKRFDSQTFEGSEIACMEVPGRYAADEWTMVETTNLRKGPFAGAEVIGTVKRGTTLLVIAEERKWLNVETADGRRGFVWSDRAKKNHSGATGAPDDPQTGTPPSSH